MTINRTRIIGLTLAAFVAGVAVAPGQSTQPTVKVTVYKDPNCGCCKNWIEHLRKHAFEVSARDTSDLAGIKTANRVPEQLYSCHTALIGGYVVEGHVPAADIRRLLQEKPRIAGIAVPGMPIGSPGMEQGSRVDRYDVIAFNRDGSTYVFAKH